METNFFHDDIVKFIKSEYRLRGSNKPYPQRMSITNKDRELYFIQQNIHNNCFDIIQRFKTHVCRFITNKVSLQRFHGL